MNTHGPPGPAEYTLGVEEEYQLVDPVTGELRSAAGAVLDADWAGDLKPEFQLSQVEIATEICRSACGIAHELSRLRMQASTAAAVEGLAIVAAGLHPFAHWRDQLPSPGERYDRLRARFGRVVRTEHTFGMHTHVGVPERIERAAVIARARWFLPHLLALSASSPVYEDEDTGFSSYRTVLAWRLSQSGPPPEFSSDEEYRRYLRILVRAGLLEDEFTIYWGIRLHPTYPTVEFRATDVCPRLDDAVSIAALTRALVVGVVEGVHLPEAAGPSLPVTARDALLSSNVWAVARYGLDAVLAAPQLLEGREPVRDSIRRLRDAVGPVAERLGDGPELERIECILEGGNGADRVRARHRRGDSGAQLVAGLVDETMLATGLDRRRTPRGVAAVEVDHREPDTPVSGVAAESIGARSAKAK